MVAEILSARDLPQALIALRARSHDGCRVTIHPLPMGAEEKHLLRRVLTDDQPADLWRKALATSVLCGCLARNETLASLLFPLMNLGCVKREAVKDVTIFAGAPPLMTNHQGGAVSAKLLAPPVLVRAWFEVTDHRAFQSSSNELKSLIEWPVTEDYSRRVVDAVASFEYGDWSVKCLSLPYTPDGEDGEIPLYADVAQD